MESKRCPGCGKEKTLDCFTVAPNGQPVSRCSSCNVPWSGKKKRRQKKNYSKADVEFVINRMELNGKDY